MSEVNQNFYGNAYGVSPNIPQPVAPKLTQFHLDSINQIAVDSYASGNLEIYNDAITLSNKIRQAII